MTEGMEPAVEVDRRWRIRKEISVPTLGFLLAQAVATTWLMSSAWSDVHDNLRAADRRLEKLEKVDSENRLTRLEADGECTKQLLIRLEQAQGRQEDKLDRVLERLPKQ